ncbi:MAG: plastocyanin/azurin family copper-binding protein [Actinomycetota bacterium]
MAEVDDRADVHEEFPGSVGVRPAVEPSTIGGAPSGVSLTGGQSFLVAGAALASVLAIVVGIAVLVRIGADENRGGGGGAVAAGPVTELTVGANEFAFDPANVELAVGEELTVTMENTGSVEHEWLVLNEGVRLTDEADFTEDMVLAGTDRVQGGESSTVSFTLDESGTYQVVCLVSGHLAAGMVGVVTAS